MYVKQYSLISAGCQNAVTAPPHPTAQTLLGLPLPYSPQPCRTVTSLGATCSKPICGVPILLVLFWKTSWGPCTCHRQSMSPPSASRELQLRLLLVHKWEGLASNHTHLPQHKTMIRYHHQTYLQHKITINKPRGQAQMHSICITLIKSFLICMWDRERKEEWELSVLSLTISSKQQHLSSNIDQGNSSL